MHNEAPPGLSKGRFGQELVHLTRAFSMAPVPNPAQIEFFRAVERLKVTDVRSLMEGPGTRNTELIGVDAPYGLAERQHSVYQIKMESENFCCTRVGTMMAIMK